MKKRIDKKISIILAGLILLAAGFSYAVYAAGVVFFGGSAAQTVVSFTTVGTTSWTVPDGVTSVEVLVVGGGGGTGYDVGGGGGGGGVVYHSSKAVTPGQSYMVTVGDGGTSGQANTVKGGNGGNSVFSDITAIGGGGGGSYSGNGVGLAGGSGGGGGDQNAAGGGATQGNSGGGTGYGYAGGTSAGAWGGAGGGGAGGLGQNGITGQVVNGGQGYISSISGSSVEYGKGGKGNSDGGVVNSTPANVGQGAMGTGSPNASPYSGGSGIVIIRYGKSKIAAGSIQKGLVGHWALDGDGYNASTGRVTDTTPYENHGTNNGATLTTDRMGQANGAMNFDGSSNYVDIGNSIPTLTEGTVSIWEKRTASTGTYQMMFTDGGSQLEMCYIDVTNLVFYVNNVGTFSSAPNLGQWYHLVGTFSQSGNYVRVYVNGILAGSGAYPGDATAATRFIGGRGGSYPFNGAISDVRIYNRALSATEVATLYGAYKPKVTAGSLQQGLVLDLPLTSTYTKTVTAGSQIMTDKSAYSNDGQNYGATVGADSTSFNGSNTYVDAGNGASLNLSTAITMSAWVNPSAVSSLGNIVSKNGNGGFRYRIQSNNNLWFYVSGNAVSGGNVPLNSWSHVVAVGDGSGLKIYVNGVNVGSNSTPYAPTNAEADNLFIGTSGGGEYFNGSISAVKVYNRALAAAEVKSLYDKGR